MSFSFYNTDDFNYPWIRAENASCNRFAKNIFRRMLQWDREYFERIENNTWHAHGYPKRKGKGKWIPGPLYSVTLPVVKKHERPWPNSHNEVAYFPRVVKRQELVNLGAKENTRLLVSDMERIPNMPLPFRNDDAPPGVNTGPGTGFQMTKRFKGKFCLSPLGHALPHTLVEDDMYCPFCPGLKIRSGRELWNHCRKWDYRHTRFPQLCRQRRILDAVTGRDELQTRYLCGEIWDFCVMRRKYDLGPSDFPESGNCDCASAHRGFGLYFQRRYKESYVAWQHARLVPGLRKYFEDHKVGDCWELVNAHLRW